MGHSLNMQGIYNKIEDNKDIIKENDIGTYKITKKLLNKHYDNEVDRLNAIKLAKKKYRDRKRLEKVEIEQANIEKVEIEQADIEKVEI